MSMITACAWVARGLARATPLRSQEDPLARDDKSVAQSIVAVSEAAVAGEVEDDEEMEEEEEEEVVLGSGAARMDADGDDDDDGGDVVESDLALEGGGAMLHASNADDPYMTAPGELELDDDGNRDTDMLLSSADALLLMCSVSDGESNLEVHVYNEEEGSFYVHHDVPLSAFPLCIEALDFRPGSLGSRGGDGGGRYGNLAAIGTFEPEIEIIDLDVCDAIEPAAVLGTVEHGHTDAVMGLAWNREHRNLLASASADCTARLWDLSTEQCRLTMRHHSDKVQSLAWHPLEPSILATASFDRSASVLDVRAHSNGVRFALPSDAESLTWNPHTPDQFTVSCDSGVVLCYDVRRGGAAEPVFVLQAHDEACSSVSFSPGIPGLMATSSIDGTVKLWDLASTEGSAPQCVVEKTMAIGRVFCCEFWQHSPFLLAAGGDRSELTVAVWETSEQPAMAERFGTRIIEAVRELGLDALRPEEDGERAEAAVALSTAAADDAAASAAGAVAPPPAPTSAGKRKKKKKGKRR